MATCCISSVIFRLTSAMRQKLAYAQTAWALDFAEKQIFKQGFLYMHSILPTATR